jgi:predicted site-specific integrase-resolvase
MTEIILQKFTRESVTAYLIQRGAGAVLNTRAVAKLLNRDVQSVRRFVKTGRLKCDMSACNRAVYRLENVVDFILVNPRFVTTARPRIELTDEVVELMRRIAWKHWRPLVDAVGIDDLIADAGLRLMRQSADESSVGAVIERTFAAIYQSRQRQVQTIPLDESITAEAETTDSEDGDEDVRAELARLAMTIPIDEVRDIVKYYTRRR